MRISIVVPSFNAVETIERTLGSLVKQSCPDLEIICVDGQSTDGTQSVIARFADDVSVFISEPDRCQAEALNKGFAVATGEVLGWLCADDELAPGALSRIASLFSTAPDVDVITGGCRRVFGAEISQETTPEPEYLDYLFLKNTIEQPSTFWRRAVYQSVGTLNESLRFAFDWEYWCRMKLDGANFMSIPDILSIYYFSDTNLTSTGGRAITDEMYRIVREFGPYRGRLAWAYKLLYHAFDLRGFYDQESRPKKPGAYVFHITLRILYLLYDNDSINAYNWNFASRQERGLGW